MDVAAVMPWGGHSASLVLNLLIWAPGLLERHGLTVWSGAVPGAASPCGLPTFGAFPFAACPHPHSTLQAQVAADSLLAAALLPFSCWVAALFLFYVFYFLSCCQSKPLPKPT